MKLIGLGDQGLPMATAIAEAAFELHVWPAGPRVHHDTVTLLAEACDIVELCVSTDEDVLHPGARFCRR
jgi:3-hydroxyisobutyrate dehydrogenase-like beta-hydroxyacid dehydrogenase